MTVDVNGVALHVRDEGEGDPVALLHGHTLDLRVWDDLAGRLGTAGFRTVRWDQRGHGRSGSPASGYRFGDHAADGAELLQRLDAWPAHLIGLSKGGGIALEMALRHPEVTRSLVLVAPLVPDRVLSSELMESFRGLTRAIRAEGPQLALRKMWLSHPLIAAAMARPGVREHVEAMTLAFPAGEYFASRRDDPDRDWKVTHRLGEISFPTLVITGEDDITDFGEMAHEVAAGVPHAALEKIPGCGHLVPLLEPDVTAALTIAFLRSLP